MNDINKVVLVGRLTRESELKKVGEHDLCNFSIASNFWQGKNKEDGVSFFDCFLWGAGAVTFNNCTSKGSKILIVGELRQERFEKDGVKRSAVKIKVDEFTFMDHKPTREDEPDEHEYNGRAPKAQAANRKVNPPIADETFSDDEVPF